MKDCPHGVVERKTKEIPGNPPASFTWWECRTCEARFVKFELVKTFMEKWARGLLKTIEVQEEK